MTRRLSLDVVHLRGECVESRHRVHAAVVDANGTLLGAAGDPALATFWRSCAKPFQVMPALASGCFEAAGWAEDELALACASHGGEPEHVALARRMLESIGLNEGDLACGTHEPLSRRGARLAEREGAPLSRLHNNCSGKHATMLAHARHRGWPLLGYERRGHPVQEGALGAVAEWSGVPAAAVRQAVDGCGVVTFGLPLGAMALAFARFGAAAHRGDELPRRILGAITARPSLFGGTDRFDTVLLEETRGTVIAKVGAEGVHTAAVPAAGLGLAVKVEDGATRAQHPALLRLLQHLRVLHDDLPPRLAAFLRAPVLNTRGEDVGVVRPAE